MLILALVSSARVMKKLKQLRRDQLKLTDARVKATNEALLAIRVVQSNSWEGALGAQIDEIRAQELALIRKTAFLQAYVKFLYFAIQVMVALSTFVTFAGLGGVLRASDIFSCIALFALMQVRKHLTWLRHFVVKRDDLPSELVANIQPTQKRAFHACSATSTISQATLERSHRWPSQDSASRNSSHNRSSSSQLASHDPMT